MSELFKTVRSKVLEAYSEANTPFVCNTLPYHSTRQLVASVEGNVGDVAFAVFAAGQELRFFSYGMGDPLVLGANQSQARMSDTNLAKSSSTNGASDFIIEGFAMHARGVRVSYPDAAGWGSPPTGNVALANVGSMNIYDPAAIFAPPQVQSPFNLEDGLLQHLAPLVSVKAEWDQSRTLALGTLDLLPRGGGGSMLRANGLPTSENRFRVPEGLIWRRDGQPDSEFAFVAKLERDLLVPISLVVLPGGSVADVPSAIYVEIVCRLYGLSVTLPSQI